MKKILFCLFLLFGISFANDKSGLFAGFELGVSEIDLKSGGKKLLSLSVPFYGVNVGYEHYFSNSIGLDVYFGFKSSYSNENKDGVKDASNANTYMADVDFLYDFYSNKDASLNLGLLAGIGLGAMVVKSGGDFSSFYGDFKVGLRNNFGHNIVSLIAVFPMIVAKDSVNGVEYKFKRNYSVSLAYAYKF